eukprot:gnl/TRDRNA2_/TRDRNA2_51609_c0_seq1.p1 gnl/TRDRNA2_/TRDRNA2_51609_c0~~gnl/TRDRNA2_/TRDRNA2_51609_c0_seq1.p1  ORF type:complete len:307 (+),score=47.92 gnl/TRDRNA2_/TRDRNA2_51609_c0_seq1:81-1001(+)
MVCRKPGGKYKGATGRKKTPEELAQEAAEKARKKHEATLAKLNEKRERAAMAGLGLMTKEEEEREARKQRIMNLLMGGKSPMKIMRQFWTNWQLGMRKYKEETLTKERERGWRMCCTHDLREPGGCGGYHTLQDIEYVMPYVATGGLSASSFFPTKEAAAEYKRKSGLLSTGHSMLNTVSSSFGASSMFPRKQPLVGSNNATRDGLALEDRSRSDFTELPSIMSQSASLPSLLSNTNMSNTTCTPGFPTYRPPVISKNPTPLFVDARQKNTPVVWEECQHWRTGTRMLVNRANMQTRYPSQLESNI